MNDGNDNATTITIMLRIEFQRSWKCPETSPSYRPTRLKTSNDHVSSTRLYTGQQCAVDEMEKQLFSPLLESSEGELLAQLTFGTWCHAVHFIIGLFARFINPHLTYIVEKTKYSRTSYQFHCSGVLESLSTFPFGLITLYHMGKQADEKKEWERSIFVTVWSVHWELYTI